MLPKVTMYQLAESDDGGQIVRQGCRYCQYVGLTLVEAKVPHKVILINSNAKPESFLKINPKGTMPVLTVDDKAIVDSASIVKFIDAKLRPAGIPSLLNNDNEETRIGGIGLTNAIWNLLGHHFKSEKSGDLEEKKKASAERKKLGAMLKEVERALQLSGGPFLSGARV